jgi:hypothetical protein
MAKEFNWEKCGAIGQWAIGLVGFGLWGFDHVSQSSGGRMMQWIPLSLIALAIVVAALLHVKAATIKKGLSITGQVPTAPPRTTQAPQLPEIASAQSLTKAPEGTLTIHSAEWIPKEHGSRRQVGKFIREQVKEAIMDCIAIRLINSNLGGDPAKDTHKTLKLSYSYGNDGPHEIVKDEYDWLILPQLAPATALVAAPSSPARLLINYRTTDIQEWIVFINDGPVTLQRIRLDHIRIDRQKRGATDRSTSVAPIILSNVIGILISGDKRECRFTTMDGNNSCLLSHLMRKYLQFGWDTDYVIPVSYEDTDGHAFGRDFTLQIDPHDQIAVEAGPVKIGKPSALEAL